MDITFKKDKKNLQGEVKVKSMELEHIDEDFQPEIEECSLRQKFITISPECMRCNLCAEECPVGAVTEAKSDRQPRVTDKCVKCEICAETCPIGAVKVIESISDVNEGVKFRIKNIKVPHRKLKLKNIGVDKEKCRGSRECVKFCPTGAITIEEEKAVIDTDLCIGCGACVNVCPEKAIVLERELGPVIKTKNLLVDPEACVQCQVCEENCPVEAIELEGDEVVLSQDKCILCDVCSTKCPVGALKLEGV
ncbi:MAG TPA: 4Fe-4S binding protein [Methanobacterium sp.]